MSMIKLMRNIEIRKLVWGICLNNFYPSCCCFIISFVKLHVLFNLLSETSMFLSIYLKAIVLRTSLALLN